MLKHMIDTGPHNLELYEMICHHALGDGAWYTQTGTHMSRTVSFFVISLCVWCLSIN